MFEKNPLQIDWKIYFQLLERRNISTFSELIQIALLSEKLMRLAGTTESAELNPSY
jgi:hypothetical protein